jgi:hypothetical protein
MLLPIEPISLFFFNVGNFRFQAAEDDLHDAEKYNLFYDMSQDTRHYLENPREQLEIAF